MLDRIILLLALAAPSTAHAAVRVSGVVRDTAGQPVAVAIVTLRGGGVEAKAPSDIEGKFELRWDGPDDVSASVDAEGYAARRQPLRLSEVAESGVTFVLARAAFGEEVTVTGGAQRVGGDNPASLVVLSREELASHPAPTLDDVLRQVPGFTLFRRSGSRVANPTAQGVTLRGLGGSGASRALVLDDGVPLNDPFGGWVYWGRTPQGALDRVEVLRGGASNRYGSGALAGVINLVRANGRERRLDVDGMFGSQRTYDLSGFAQASQDRWIMRVAAQGFKTGGSVTVHPGSRGNIDVPTTAKFLSEEVALEHAWAGGTRLFARGNIYGEKRGNGTPLQRNESEIKQLALGFDRPFTSGGAFTVRAYVADQFFEQVFSAVAADRESEQLTREQNVPADSSGASASFSHALGGATILLGVDRSRVEASNIETAFLPPPGGETTVTGTQRNTGAFADLALPIGRGGSLTFGARYDRWKNDGEDEDRSEKAVSPRAALVLKLGSRVSVVGSAYRAFRAPTLNELYRSFRVGNVETRANPALEAERIGGAEAGLVFGSRRFSLRATAFRMTTEDTVASVTLSSTPSLILRQRQNLGSARSQGLELDAELRAGIAIFQAGWLRADATVRSFEADPALVGLRLPQVPRDQGTLSVRLVGASGRTLALYARSASPQFDDDRNVFRLGRARTLDAFAALPITGDVDLVAAGENLLNARYEVGRTPLVTIGPPRAARIGLRLRLASLPVVQPD